MNARAATTPLTVLVDEWRGEPYPLTESLLHRYGGPFGLTTPSIYANFVASVDGVVSLAHEDRNSGSAISGRNDADRFIMGLLRACADAVLLGAGTLRATPHHRWTADDVYPAAAADFQELRRRLGRSAMPRLVVLTSNGDIDLGHPGLDGGMVVTNESTAATLRSAAPAGVAIRALTGDGRVRVADAVAAIRADGHASLLTEGGPRVVGELLRAHLLDELFLTVAPRLFGRDGGAERLAVLEGIAFAPEAAPSLQLSSLRGVDSFLYARYRVAQPGRD